MFPTLEYDAYFNHASISPMSTGVHAATTAALDTYSRRGAAAWMTFREQRDRLRKSLAELIGAEAADVGLVPSTSQGVVHLAFSLPWKRGDRVILFDGEFPANVTPWQGAAETFGLELTFLSASDFATEDGERRLRDTLAERSARLVAVSAVQFQTGLRMPLDTIGRVAHEFGAEVFVDAIQAVGVVPLDVARTPIDYLVAGSHKWLMGPEGAGFAWIHPDRMHAIEPRLASWLSHEDGARFLFEGAGHLRYDRPIRKRADFLEIGAQNTFGFAGLEAAIEPITQIGVDAIHEHVNSILDDLEAGLLELGFESERSSDPQRRSGILSVIPPAPWPLRSLFDHLVERRIGCAIPDGRLRFSPHWPNDRGQCEKILSALGDFDPTGS